MHFLWMMTINSHIVGCVFTSVVFLTHVDMHRNRLNSDRGV